MRGVAEAESCLQPSFAGGCLPRWSGFSWPPLQGELPAEHRDSLSSGATVARPSCGENCGVNIYPNHTHGSACRPETHVLGVCPAHRFPCVSLRKSVRVPIKPCESSDMPHTPVCPHYTSPLKPRYAEETAVSGAG